jgi:hypothetical protein
LFHKTQRSPVVVASIHRLEDAGSNPPGDEIPPFFLTDELNPVQCYIDIMQNSPRVFSANYTKRSLTNF